MVQLNGSDPATAHQPPRARLLRVAHGVAVPAYPVFNVETWIPYCLLYTPCVSSKLFLVYSKHRIFYFFARWYYRCPICKEYSRAFICLVDDTH